jgi:DNA polymerase III epsilon subunit-like protein
VGLFGKRRTASDDEILVFDTETSDLPRNWDLPASRVDNWPRLVQIAWIVCDLDFSPRRRFCTLICPDGFEIAPGAVRVHGITTQRARAHGMPIVEVLPRFDQELQACALVVAHNLEFDQTIMQAEFIRAGLPDHFADTGAFCSMRGTAPLCQLEPKRHGEYKWPKLSELHELCTGRSYAGAHDAMQDAEALRVCMRHLVKKHFIRLQVEPKAQSSGMSQ